MGSIHYLSHATCVGVVGRIFVGTSLTVNRGNSVNNFFESLYQNVSIPVVVYRCTATAALENAE